MHVQDSREVARLSLSTPVADFVFDLLAFENFDLRPVPLEDRKRILARLIKGEGPIRYCDHFLARGRDFYHAVAEAGLEGMIAKRRAPHIAASAPAIGSRSSARRRAAS